MLKVNTSQLFRRVLRMLFAVCVAMALLMLWVTNVGRGFLPSHRQVHWIEAQHRDGDWTISLLGTADEQDENPALETKGEIVIRVLESSMGRTDPGEWGRWRGSHWVATEIAYDSDGWTPWDPSKQLEDEQLHLAFSQFVERELIPTSKALAIWPNGPYRLTVNGTHWWAHQHQFSVVALAATIAMCLAVGVVVSFIVLPPRRLSSSPATAMPEGSSSE